jgi:NADPH-dependent 7-cyano-7-deazaguanine reductase QueF-like protein
MAKKLKQDAIIEIQKSNRMARSQYKCSFTEKRVMEFILSQVNQNNDSFDWITLNPDEYAQIYDIPSSNAYRDIINGSKALSKLSITIDQCDEELIKKQPFCEINYKPRQGNVKLLILDEFKKELLQFNKNKTRYYRYSLNVAAKFKEIYTWKFYELLMSWINNNGKGWFTISFIDLKFTLAVPDSYNWAIFEERILTRAIKDIKKHAQINVKLEVTQKRGRSVKQLKLSFNKSTEAKKETTPKSLQATPANDLSTHLISIPKRPEDDNLERW